MSDGLYQIMNTPYHESRHPSSVPQGIEPQGTLDREGLDDELQITPVASDDAEPADDDDSFYISRKIGQDTRFAVEQPTVADILAGLTAKEQRVARHILGQQPLGPEDRDSTTFNKIRRLLADTKEAADGQSDVAKALHELNLKVAAVLTAKETDSQRRRLGQKKLPDLQLPIPAPLPFSTSEAACASERTSGDLSVVRAEFFNANPRAPEGKRFCYGCGVRRPCLEYALSIGAVGIWGGTDSLQRVEIQRLRSAGKAQEAQAYITEIDEQLEATFGSHILLRGERHNISYFQPAMQKVLKAMAGAMVDDPNRRFPDTELLDLVQGISLDRLRNVLSFLLALKKKPGKPGHEFVASYYHRLGLRYSDGGLTWLGDPDP